MLLIGEMTGIEGSLLIFVNSVTGDTIHNDTE